MTELREAIGIVSSENPKSLQSRNIPWRQAVERVFAPLIETQEDPENRGENFCYLFHSTVRDFLIRNQDVFRQDAPFPAIHAISELTIANACLLYLSQDRYSQLLTNEAEQWITTTKDNIKDHHLLTYSAKYWDKHFDQVEETPELRRKIEGFLTSPNFQSTIQLQSLFVQGQFGIYTSGRCSPEHKFTKRVFPQWFASDSIDTCSSFLVDYRTYISEWQSLLSCADCQNPRCYSHSIVKRFRGGLDHCLWGALGPRNFLSSSSGRFSSFMLCIQNISGATKMPYQEAISQDGKQVVVLQLAGEPTDTAKSTFHQSTWSLLGPKSSELLSSISMISTSASLKRWIDAELRSTSFTEDLYFLRLGSQIFAHTSGGEYRAVSGLNTAYQYPNSCFEDITCRASLLVMASRRKMPAVTESRGREVSNANHLAEKQLEKSDDGLLDSGLGKDLSIKECRHCSREPSESNHASDTSPAKEEAPSGGDDSDSDSPSLSEDISEWNSAEESWSEGSTEADELGDPLISSSGCNSDSSEADVDSDDESEAPQDEDASDAAVHNYGQLYEESDSDGGDIDFDCSSEDESYDGDYESDPDDADNHEEDLHWDSDDEVRLARRMAYSKRDKKRGAKIQRGILAIYDTSSSPPTQIFQFTQPLPIILYDSPPAVHPTRSLVVWPLCGGDVLFADYVAKSYFIRRARTTTRKSKSSHYFVIENIVLR